ncbi:hypothetical protein OIT44_03240 [Weissella ceti]|uniref:Uncharacterized protein n=1 Tax=Weissella ceti TaxID=759620 RepID=A0ABT3E4E2_9LACO|nr:hypothetical protein [Weissella ceti]MCW0953087.1 hypothetical protein [Weissella ceti]QVK11630.1 hypothetical protein KHQ31_05250 [Weissella ceti]
MATLITFALGLLFMAWGYYRIKTDFAKNQSRNNLLQLIFTGQASGIGQFLSGVVFMIISVITLFVK